MRFALTDEQAAFAEAVGDLLASGDSVAAARAWAAGDTAPGLGLWKRLAELGVAGLVVPESEGGVGGSYVDLVVAHEALGRHLAVGPWIESSAYLATALPAVDRGDDAGRIADGAIGTVAVPPVPYALDADVADQVWLRTADGLSPAAAGEPLTSVDATRRLFAVSLADEAPADHAFDVAALACAAQLLGAGERVLADTVAYVRQRQQFGRPIGSFQAIKHHLADVRIALDFARPLVYGAALSASTGSTTGSRDISAAKAACADAAWLAARTGLQSHGAVGYTRELDLGLWILRIRALVPAWGTPAFHRGRVLDALESR